MIEVVSATIVPADRMIAINGEAYQSAEFEFAPPLPSVAIARMEGPAQRGLFLHAIQWFGDHGQIEPSAGPASGFTDRGIIEAYVPQWLAVRAAELARRADHAATQLTHHDGLIQCHRNALAALEKDMAAAAENPALRLEVKDGLAAHRARVEAELAELEARSSALEAAGAQAKTKADAAAEDAKA